MNAGAQGSCTAQWLQSVRVIPLHGGESFELQCDQLSYDYRHSRLQEEPLVVVSARFRLEAGHDPQKIGSVTNGNLSHRTTTQPYQQPSCGSVFRNPEPLKAGRLIEGQGLKGTRIGGAEVSTLHANFIVNTGAARSGDIDGRRSQCGRTPHRRGLGAVATHPLRRSFGAGGRSLIKHLLLCCSGTREPPGGLLSGGAL